MNLKSLLVSFALVAATSTAALARPAMFVVEAEASFTVDGPAIRDHRDVRAQDRVVRDHRGSWFRPVFRPTVPAPEHIYISNNKIIRSNGYTWSQYHGPIYARSEYSRGFSALTDATRLEANKQEFWLNGAQAQQLQLRTIAGSTNVTQVAIELGPNKMQVVKLNRDLRHGAITIDLEGHTRSMIRVIVYGSSSNNSAYQILSR